MVQTVTSSAASTTVSQTVNAKTKVVETDSHSIIMRQIVALQTQLKGLYEKLSATPPKDIEQRLLLQRQIQGIEDEIAALQSALISTENKKVMELQQARTDKAKANQAKSSSAANLTNAANEPGAGSAPAFAASPAVHALRPAADAIGGVIARSTNAEPGDSVNLAAPDAKAGDAGYTSSGESDTTDAEPVGANVDVMA